MAKRDLRHDDLIDAGIGLTEAVIEWGKRPATPPRVALTDRDLAIFVWLEQHRFATAQMLAALFFDARWSAVMRRLKLLHDIGYLDKFRPTVARTAGSAKWIFCLTQRGWLALCDAGLSATGRLPFGELTDLAYVSHDLQLDALLLSIAMRELPGSGPLTNRLPFQILGPDIARVPRDGGPRPDTTSAAAALPEGHIVARGDSSAGLLEPDATLLGTHVQSGLPFAVMIEYDRTLRPSKQRDRWRRYDRFLAETWREGRFADYHSAPLVVYLLPRTKLLPTFLKEADKHLTAWIGPTNSHPSRGSYPGRDFLLFTSRERLLDGDWTMECLPAQPAGIRGTATVHSRPVHVPLMRLFATVTVTRRLAA
jgi:hypothetical protein